MKKFDQLSVKRKITVLAVFTSSIALMLACIAFISYERYQSRSGLVRELSILAEVIGNNSTAALLFEDKKAAEKILSTLQSEQDIEAGCIYGIDNEPFVTYVNDNSDIVFPRFEENSIQYFQKSQLKLIRPIILEDEIIGKIYIQHNTRQITIRLLRYLVIAVIVFLLSVFVAFLVIYWLQGSIAVPFQQLAHIANLVSFNKDYSIRAKKMSKDELGLLTDRFNEMLGQIEERDKALQKNQEELEKRVRERTKELEQEIIEKEKAENAKDHIQAQLMHAQTMEAVGVLAGGIAHDFNNLLTGIQGCTEMVLLDNEISDPTYQDLREIQVAVDRAANLTRQLLMFSRKQPMVFIPLSFNEVIEDLSQMLHRLIGETIEINTHFEPRLRTVKADRGTMEQIILNIAVNARDAMPDGGTFTMITENVTMHEDECKNMTDAYAGEFVRISLEDTGMGMDEKTIKHIFEPFFTTKGVGKGTGLGLSVVYGIVQQHNGWMHIDSKPGIGARFELYLPAVEEKYHVIADVPSPYEDYYGQRERILLVEDEEHVLKFTKRALERYGYLVFPSGTVDEAKTLYGTEEGKFDLIFSDVVLPDGTGIEIIKDLLIMQYDLKFVLTSGYTSDKSHCPLITELGLPFLPKPFVLMDLLKIIRYTLDKEKIKVIEEDMSFKTSELLTPTSKTNRYS